MSCNSTDDEADLKNRISLTIKLVDKETKKKRVNDKVEIYRKEESFPLHKKILVGTYYTDSSGAVRINLISNKMYSIFTVSNNKVYPVYYSNTDILESKLKDGNEIIIEVEK